MLRFAKIYAICCIYIHIYIYIYKHIYIHTCIRTLTFWFTKYKEGSIDRAQIEQVELYRLHQKVTTACFILRKNFQVTDEIRKQEGFYALDELFLSFSFKIENFSSKHKLHRFDPPKYEIA